MMKSKPKSIGMVRRFFGLLGPGLITGAADDDPSGVATYTIACAQLGTSMLSTAFITWPLMGCVQFMCARIGMVTGQGLGAAFGRYFYGVIIFSTAVGIAMDFVGINPVKALFCTAVINGVLAPFLLIGI